MKKRIKHSIPGVFFSRRMLVTFVMGFACGLPLFLTMGVLQAWMTEKGVDLAIIGLITLVQLPYNWKFLWAPFLDRYTPSFLGRRKGWLLLAQIALLISIGGLGFSDPEYFLKGTILLAFLVCFFSATQDIIVDAYRREDLPNEELGLGASIYMYGYRLGTLLASGGGLILADHVSWTTVYLIMAGCLLPCIITTLLSPEPVTQVSPPSTLKHAMIEPLKDFFQRSGSFWILVFIVLYKIGDTMAGAFSIPFYKDLEFSNTEIGAVVKIFGSWAIIAGALTGGLMMIRMGINRCLWIFGILQALSTACFAILAQIGHNNFFLSFVISFENLSSGMGTAAFLAFLASITNKKFTATQYALLSSLMAIPRIMAAPAGLFAKHLGWEAFFIGCSFAAIPGILILLKIAPWNERT